MYHITKNISVTDNNAPNSPHRLYIILHLKCLTLYGLQLGGCRIHITKQAKFTMAHMIKKHMVKNGATISRLPLSPTSREIMHVSINARKGSSLCVTLKNWSFGMISSHATSYSNYGATIMH